MGKYFGTDVPATGPTNDLEEPGSKTGGRSVDGGGYSRQAVRALEQAGYPGAEHPGKGDPLAAGEHTSGDPGFWDRGVHAGA